MKTVTAHVLVRNEARFVWFAVMSVINYVDSVLLWDTGSVDETRVILKEIKKLYPNKVDLRFLEEVSINEFKDIRQAMLEATQTDWFLMVDGDEIWWEDSIQKVISEIKVGSDIESVVVPTFNLVGDIYHYQEELAGLYQLAGRKGHYNLRAINRGIPGLKSSGPHGTWGWVDENDKMIQDRDAKKVKFMAAPYLHASFLERAGSKKADQAVPKRAKKLKHEIGIEFPRDYYYPEVFFRDRPMIIPSPWQTMTLPFYLRSLIETPLRKLKRRVLPTQVGY